MPSIITDTLHNSFIKYVIVGGTTFLLDYFGLLFWIRLLGEQNLVLANLLATGIALVYNYTLANFWTFEAGKERQVRKITRYAAIVIFNYTFANVSFNLLSALGVTYLVSKVIITGSIMCWSYFLYKYWVFK